MLGTSFVKIVGLCELSVQFLATAIESCPLGLSGRERDRTTLLTQSRFYFWKNQQITGLPTEMKLFLSMSGVVVFGMRAIKYFEMK